MSDDPQGLSRLAGHYRGDTDKNTTTQSQPASRSGWKPLAKMAIVVAGLGGTSVAMASPDPTAQPAPTGVPVLDDALIKVALSGLQMAGSLIQASQDTAMLAPVAERKPFRTMAGYAQASVWEQDNINLSDTRMVYSMADKAHFEDKVPVAFGQDVSRDTLAKAAKRHDPASRRITAGAETIEAARKMSPEAQIATINSMGNMLVQYDNRKLAELSIGAYARGQLKTQSVEESETLGAGICQDQAIVKLRGLRALGYGPDRAQIVHIGVNTRDGDGYGHAVVAVSLKSGRYILDDKVGSMPIPESRFFQVPDYGRKTGVTEIFPIASLDENGVTNVYETTRSKAAGLQQQTLAAATAPMMKLSDLPHADQRDYLRVMAHLASVPKASFPPEAAPAPVHHAHARTVHHSQPRVHMPLSGGSAAG